MSFNHTKHAPYIIFLSVAIFRNTTQTLNNDLLYLKEIWWK